MPSPKKLSPDSASMAPPTPKVNDTRKIGAKSGEKYLKIIFVLFTFASCNIFINGLSEIAKLSLRISLAIPIHPVIDITITKTKIEAKKLQQHIFDVNIMLTTINTPMPAIAHEKEIPDNVTAIRG